MHIYEYRCKDCNKKNSFLILKKESLDLLRCNNCGGKNLVRLVSRFAAIKSEESRLERLADPCSFADLDENNPRSVAKFMKRMGKEMWEDLGADFDEEVEKAIEEDSMANNQPDSDNGL